MTDAENCWSIIVVKIGGTDICQAGASEIFILLALELLLEIAEMWPGDSEN